MKTFHTIEQITHGAFYVEGTCSCCGAHASHVFLGDNSPTQLDVLETLEWSFIDGSTLCGSCTETEFKKYSLDKFDF